MNLKSTYLAVLLSILPIRNSNSFKLDSSFLSHMSNSTEFISSTLIKSSHSVAMVGDLMLGSVYPYNKKFSKKYKESLFLNADSVLHSTDILCGNLEGVISDSVNAFDLNGAYNFQMSEDLVDVFSDASFDFLSIANNHSYDFGNSAQKRTQEVLDSNNISYAGSTNVPYSVLEKEGVTYGFAAFSLFRGTNSMSKENVKETVSKLDSLADIVIVSFHAGGEGLNYSHIGDTTEHYLGEYRGNPYYFAHYAVDCGADIVFGHGPHVPRALELYNNKLISYSLGNFVTKGTFSFRKEQSLAPLLVIDVDSVGDFSSGRIYSFKQSKKEGLYLDSTNSAIKQIKNLTESDFPNSLLIISEKGIISKDTSILD